MVENGQEMTDTCAGGRWSGRHVVRALGAMSVTGGLLWWVLRQVDLDAVVGLLVHANAGWLALAYAVFLLAALVHAWRFSVLLSATGRPPQFLQLVRAHYIGLTCNTILPGELGLDAVRVQMASRAAGGRTKVLAVVMIDRLNGAVAVAALSCLACCLLLASYDLPIWFIAPSLAVLAMGLSIGILAGQASGLAVGSLAARVPMPAFIRERCVTLLETVSLTVRGGARLLPATALAGLQCVLLAIALAMMSRGLELPASELAVAAIFPIISIITLTVPISLNGLGVREAMFCLTGAAVGLDENQALALASAWLLTVLLGCVPGVIGIVGLAPNGK